LDKWLTKFPIISVFIAIVDQIGSIDHASKILKKDLGIIVPPNSLFLALLFTSFSYWLVKRIATANHSWIVNHRYALLVPTATIALIVSVTVPYMKYREYLRTPLTVNQDANILLVRFSHPAFPDGDIARDLQPILRKAIDSLGLQITVSMFPQPPELIDTGISARRWICKESGSPIVIVQFDATLTRTTASTEVCSSWLNFRQTQLDDILQVAEVPDSFNSTQVVRFCKQHTNSISPYVGYVAPFCLGLLKLLDDRDDALKEFQYSISQSLFRRAADVANEKMACSTAYVEARFLEGIAAMFLGQFAKDSGRRVSAISQAVTCLLDVEEADSATSAWQYALGRSLYFKALNSEGTARLELLNGAIERLNHALVSQDESPYIWYFLSEAFFSRAQLVSGRDRNGANEEAEYAYRRYFTLLSDRETATSSQRFVFDIPAERNLESTKCILPLSWKK